MFFRILTSNVLTSTINFFTKAYMIETRVTNDTDKCVANIGNRYDLILIAGQRVRELRRGHKPKVTTTSTPCVAALEEIEAGLIGRDYLKKIK